MSDPQLNGPNQSSTKKSSLVSYIRGKRAVKKVAIIGPTGSGKTSFIEGFFGSIARSDVKRRRNVENSVDSGYVLTKSGDVDSLTTISLNQLSVILAVTRSNQLECKELSNREKMEQNTDYETVAQINFIDNPGQERFSFVSEATIKGSDAVILMVDGTSTTSISTMPKFLSIIHEEIMVKENRKVPIFVCVNKLDLADNNLYLGSSEVMQMMSDLIEKYGIILFETSNKNFATFEIALRTMLNVFT